MCEIAVVDPERTDVQSVFQLASTLYEEQGDGLGILAVQRNEDEEKFEYNTYKSAKPHWQRLWSFLRRVSDETWRFIVHARAMTDGDVNRKNTHPLKVECEECTTDWVVHNGVVSKHKVEREALKNDGHDFNTEVDSEVIAHEFDEVPQDVDDLDDKMPTGLRGSLNFILATEDHIAAHFQQKYHVTDDFVVSCATRKRKEPFADIEDMTNEAKWVSITPDGEIDTKDRKIWYGAGAKYTGSSSDSNYKSARRRNNSKSSTVHSKSGRTKSGSKNSGIIAETYDDLMADIDGVSAIKVAPGVIKVIENPGDDDDTREEFIKRRDEPALYSYFATDETYPTDKWMMVRQMMDDGDLPDDPDAAVDKVIRETTQDTLDGLVADEGEEVTECEACEIPSEDEEDFMPADDVWNAVMTTLTEKYGSEGEALDRMTKMSADELRAVAKESGLMPDAQETSGG